MSAGREWAAYVRVSKVNGRDGDSFVSPRQQETKIRMALDVKYGATVADEQVYVDLDRSGTDDNRPAFQEMLAWIHASPRTRGIAVMDSNRLFRNAALFLTTVERLESLGAEYLSVHQAADAKTPEGSLMRTMTAGIDQFQSDTIARRWRMVQRDRVEAGLPSGGPPRFGYQQVSSVDEDGRDVRARMQTPHPDRGPVLARMYHDFTAGQGAQKIAKGLNERGVTTGRGNPWNIQGVLRTLDSGFGAGLIHVGTEHRSGAHEPIITPEEWESYQRVRDSRRRKPARHKSPRWHLAGLAKCGLCGGNMLVASYRDPKTLVTCSTYKASRTCSGTWISKFKLDRAVFYWLGTRLDEVSKHAASARARDRARTRAATAVDRAQAQVEKLTREKVGTARLHAGGDLTASEYRSALAENHAETLAANESLVEARIEVERLAPVDDVYGTLIKWGDGRDPAEYNVLLGKVIDRVEVHQDQIVISPVIGTAHNVPRV